MMFRARGTRIVIDDKPAEPEIGLGTPADEAKYADDLALALGMELRPAAMPELPPDFGSVVRAAMGGNIEAITAMREIGAQVPAHMQIAFGEMIEDLIAEPE